jgi:uncharacterized protein YkwD
MGGNLHNTDPFRATPLLLAGIVAMIAALAMVQPGSASAHAACNHAKASPKAISTRQARKAVYCLFNKQRASHGMSRLDLNGDLNEAARGHSVHMERSGCFNHDCPGEPTVLSRLQHVDYIVSGLTSWSYGENIAYGGGRLGTPAAIVKAWMNSPDHRAAILSSNFRDLGVGVTWGIPGKPHADGGIYTADFGYRHG